MSKISVYLIPAPLGSYLSDMALSSISAIKKTQHIFVESKGRFIQKLQLKGYLTPKHELMVLDKNALNKAKILVQNGQSFAILADTGNPCFVDPGHDIIGYLLDDCSKEIELIPLGMSSALDAVLSMAGFDIQKFIFCGHYPENHLPLSFLQGGIPCVFYVAGKGVRDWIEQIEEEISYATVTLYRNIRDRDGGQIYRWKERESSPSMIANNSNDNYVAIVVPLRSNEDFLTD